ncbi:MAG: AtpZ/AtpI family protein [Alphaproteobacteria bacterium]|nr:AtpZ/AtpI family protein [Alphaproteobacteria bacterium]
MKQNPKDIEDIDARIASLKGKQTAKREHSELAKFWENGVRAAAEFIAPVFIGISIGYVLDKCFDTRIFFMLVLAIFGLAAGMLNVYRLAKQIEKEVERNK